MGWTKDGKETAVAVDAALVIRIVLRNRRFTTDTNAEDRCGRTWLLQRLEVARQMPRQIAAYRADAARLFAESETIVRRTQRRGGTSPALRASAHARCGTEMSGPA